MFVGIQTRSHILISEEKLLCYTCIHLCSTNLHLHQPAARQSITQTANIYSLHESLASNIKSDIRCLCLCFNPQRWREQKHMTLTKRQKTEASRRSRGCWRDGCWSSSWFVCLCCVKRREVVKIQRSLSWTSCSQVKAKINISLFFLSVFYQDLNGFPTSAFADKHREKSEEKLEDFLIHQWSISNVHFALTTAKKGQFKQPISEIAMTASVIWNPDEDPFWVCSVFDALKCDVYIYLVYLYLSLLMTVKAENTRLGAGLKTTDLTLCLRKMRSRPPTLPEILHHLRNLHAQRNWEWCFCVCFPSRFTEIISDRSRTDLDESHLRVRHDEDGRNKPEQKPMFCRAAAASRVSMLKRVISS